MAVLVRQDIAITGLAATFAAVAAGGDTVDIRGGRTYLHFKNTNAAARTVTLNSLVACNQGVDHNPAIVIPALTGDVWIGPLDPNRYADANGLLAMTYSADADLTVAAIQLPAA